MKASLFIGLSITGSYLASWAVGVHGDAWWSYPTMMTGVVSMLAGGGFAVNEIRKVIK